MISSSPIEGNRKKDRLDQKMSSPAFSLENGDDNGGIEIIPVSFPLSCHSILATFKYE
jgi:hypothetical protein